MSAGSVDRTGGDHGGRCPGAVFLVAPARVIHIDLAAQQALDHFEITVLGRHMEPRWLTRRASFVVAESQDPDDHGFGVASPSTGARDSGLYRGLRGALMVPACAAAQTTDGVCDSVGALLPSPAHPGVPRRPPDPVVASLLRYTRSMGPRPKETGGRVMTTLAELDRIAINVKSRRLLNQLLDENPRLAEIMHGARNETEALVGVREWVMDVLRSRPHALAYYESEHPTREDFEALEWRDYAAIRLLDYIEHADREFVDLNLRGELAVSSPIKLIWLAVSKGTGGAKRDFFEDMLHLFRQFSGREKKSPPTREQVEQWMSRYPSGLDPRIVRLREENRERILELIIDGMDRGEMGSSRYRFASDLSREQKREKLLEWWQEPSFHLSFAVRSPGLLNKMLGESLDPDTMKVLYRAREAGIPFFVNPYYLSLLHVRVPYFAIGADLAIRDYVVYSEPLVEEFGRIHAWEKEDLVKPGKPNAAGWILPTADCIHRRYPDVAILIPDTQGRACGGLCASCQRMYDFQRGHLNFDLDKLRPHETWPEKLERLMDYFRDDSQLRDILITGGDALMSSDSSLEQVLDAIYRMAEEKRNDNERRRDGEKYAEITRVRLGTRLPAYLPQRITPELGRLLADFRKRAMQVGIRQFILQTHFESPMELTPECRTALQRLRAAGWLITNQLVFTASASRRGHSAMLRQVLNEVGVVPYYSFAVKGYSENFNSYAPIARLVQEEEEEKIFGRVPEEHLETLRKLGDEAKVVVENITMLRRWADLPFLATDRSVLNLPGVGKSLTYRVIGITRYGRRVLEFDHDRTRAHSPIIEKMGKVVILESKSIGEYLRQLENIGENIEEYAGIYGYSVGQTEPRMPLFEYPPFEFDVTDELTNLDIEEAGEPVGTRPTGERRSE
ncbi:MAG: KamA family protein [Acidobacteriota bacterium]|jgi:lysine 2,3-aminomutase